MSKTERKEAVSPEFVPGTHVMFKVRDIYSEHSVQEVTGVIKKLYISTIASKYKAVVAQVGDLSSNYPHARTRTTISLDKLTKIETPYSEYGTTIGGC